LLFSISLAIAGEKRIVAEVYKPTRDVHLAATPIHVSLQAFLGRMALMSKWFNFRRLLRAAHIAADHKWHKIAENWGWQTLCRGADDRNP